MMRAISRQAAGLMLAVLMAAVVLTSTGCGGGGAGTVVAGSGNAGAPLAAEFDAQLLTGGWFGGIWGTSRDDLFAVGGGGLLAHYDGTRWVPFEAADGFEREFNAVFGFSSSDVYAVGARGRIMHYDGTTWTRQEVEPNFSRTLYDVWGSGPNDVWAAGENVIVHFDGATWTKLTPPVGADWRGVSGSGPNEVLFAGEGGFFQTAHFLRWNGASLVEIPVPPVGGNTYLSAVFSTGPGHALVGGSGGRALRWDGVQLHELARGTNEGIRDIWGPSPNELYAVGVRNTFVRYNGSTWTDIPFTVGTDSLAGLFGFAGNDLVLSGHGVYHYDGATTGLLLPAAEPAGVWASGKDNALILGEQTMRFDGQRATPEDFGGLSVPRLRAAWGPADHIIAVGEGGGAFLYDGGSWGAMTTNTTEVLTGVWGASPSDVFAVGYNGTILHFNGVAWGAMASGTSEYLSGVWGTSGSNVYAVGGNGTILHFNGASWSPVVSGVTEFLRAIVGFDASHVYIAYADGLLVGNGVTWSPRAVALDGMPVGAYALAGTSPTNLFVGLSTGLAQYDGTTTSRMSDVRYATFLASAGPRAVFAGGYGINAERVILYTAR